MVCFVPNNFFWFKPSEFEIVMKMTEVTLQHFIIYQNCVLASLWMNQASLERFFRLLGQSCRMFWAQKNSSDVQTILLRKYKPYCGHFCFGLLWYYFDSKWTHLPNFHKMLWGVSCGANLNCAVKSWPCRIL